MQRLVILFLFATLLIAAELSVAAGPRTMCVTRSRGISFRVHAGEAPDIKAEAYMRCIRSQQTRDKECDRNLQCDDEDGTVAPAPRPQPAPAPAPVAPANPSPYFPAIPLIPKAPNEILVCEIFGFRSSGPNQESITSYLVDLCIRRKDLTTCLANLYCNERPLFRFIKRCELRGNNFQVSAYGVDDRSARQNSANACRSLPGDDANVCTSESSCVDVSNRYGTDLSPRGEGRRIYTPAPVQPAPQPVAPQPQPQSTPAPFTPPSRPTGPVVAPPRPAGGGDVIVTPSTPPYRGREPEPEIPEGQGPFR